MSLLQHYFEDFLTRHDEDKLVDILRKTWNKMSDKGQRFALAMELPVAASALVQKALA